jgi:hypothetical protein
MFRRVLPLVLALSAASCGAAPAPDGTARAHGRHEMRHPLARIASDDEVTRNKAYAELTELLNRGPFPAAEVAPYAADVQRLLDAHLDRVEPAQRAEPITCGSWADRRDYVMLRWETELLLDVGGSVPGATMLGSLRRALRLADPRFRYFAVRSMLFRGDAVEAKEFAPIAASDEVRGKLFHLLSDRGRRADFPAAFANQEALARARLVDFLQWDEGLGCVPRKIELGQVVPIGAEDWFVFRYSVEGSRRSETVMLAGVAGPYARSAAPTTEGGERTSSSFQPFDAKTPEEHVQAAQTYVKDPERPVDATSGGTSI